MRERSPACAAFSQAQQLEDTYVDLLRAGVSPGDVSVLVTEEAHQLGMGQGDRFLTRLLPVQGGFTGGIRMLAVGPARSFGVTGSVATGLIRAGIDDGEAAWLMNELFEGSGLILVHARSDEALDAAHRVLDESAGDRYHELRLPVLNRAASA